MHPINALRTELVLMRMQKLALGKQTSKPKSQPTPIQPITWTPLSKTAAVLRKGSGTKTESSQAV